MCTTIRPRTLDSKRSAPVPPPPVDRVARREALVERLFVSTGGAFEMISVWLGDRLGLYRVLADDGPLTSGELAARTGTHERYVREWLEQQATVGLLAVQDAGIPAPERRFALPPGHDDVLADADCLDFQAPLAQTLVGALRPLPRLLEVFRTGGGIPFGDYGAEMREGQARVNRGMFLQLLGRDWLPAIPDVHARLVAGPAARIADVGCGGGWSSLAMARAYPAATVDGFDLDEPSVAMARRHASEAGLADRVRFACRDAGDPALSGRYDLVTAFECIHDMGRPVEVLATMRRLAADDGAVLVVDEKVNDTFDPDADGSMDWMMYGWSVLHCLPVGMAEADATGTGTVMRPDTLRAYAREAGFADVEILPIEHVQFRFYRLRG